ncbi:MAG: hypothetical protein DBW80_01290 [Bacteroidetes bacterium]|nr:MAG: hypothetical protein DBW80_01290 [Bacteroidota bacterium]
MKHHLLVLVFLLTAFLSYGQQNVGIGTDNPNPNALLELESDDKGFLMPRLNTNSRNTLGALCGPNEEGLVVYDTEEDLFFYWDGSQWIPYPGSGSGDQWGGQVVITDGSISGDGTAGNPLSVGAGSDDQNIQGSGLNGTILTIGIENGNAETVDLSTLQDGIGTDDVDFLEVGTTTVPDDINDNIYTQGNVGIGTANPVSDLHVNGLTTSQDYDIINSDGTFTRALQAGNTQGVNAPDFHFHLLPDYNGQNGANEIYMYYGFNSDVMEHLWHTKYMGSNTEIMSLDSIGNLRIIGDFRPGDQPGTVGQVLVSQGANNTPIWSSVSTGTDDQNIQGSGLSGTSLTIGIENGNSETIDLSSLQDGVGTDNQNLTGSTLIGNTLQIDIEDGSSTSVDLSPLIGTDNQVLQYIALNDQLSITNGNTVLIDDKWDLFGNSNTDENINFLGTTNNQGLTIRTDNTLRARFLADGTFVYNGPSAVLAGDMVTVNGTNGTTLGANAGTITTDYPFNVYSESSLRSAAAIYARVFDQGGGVWVESFATDTGMAAIFGEMETTFDPGVEGRNNWDHPESVGVLGLANAAGSIVDMRGVVGRATYTAGQYGYGVYGEGNWYGLFTPDNSGATGIKTFLIDHPLDPANMLLRHYSMEADEVLNVYRGNIQLDATGKGVVQLKSYAQAINTNFSYQLTAIGGAMPSLHVSQGVNNQGQFIIQGGLPNHEVSWTIYAERNDVYMQNRPELRNPEVAKKPFNIGKYFHPQDYNLGEEHRIYPRNDGNMSRE